MALKLPDHAHCGYCGDPIPFGESHCSEECAGSAAEEAGKEKRNGYILYAMAGVILVSVMIISYFI